MQWLKDALTDFPGQNGGVVCALVLILLTGLTVIVKLAFGQTFPDGYDTWIWALVALAGVNVAGMVGKRATDIEYKKAGTSPVTIEAPAGPVTVNAPPAPPIPPGKDNDP